MHSPFPPSTIHHELHDVLCSRVADDISLTQLQLLVPPPYHEPAVIKAHDMLFSWLLLPPSIAFS